MSIKTDLVKRFGRSKTFPSRWNSLRLNHPRALNVQLSLEHFKDRTVSINVLVGHAVRGNKRQQCVTLKADAKCRKHVDPDVSSIQIMTASDRPVLHIAARID